MASWDEVKRLAADFQKIQLSSTTQRLSERNCIEIVSWLINRKLVDLIFTSDGKEYITPSHLVQEIKGELYVSGGRVNFVELAKSIGVDLSHITSYVIEVVRSCRGVHSILGQLIDDTYIAKIAGEINEKLQQQGQINVSDLTIQYDLPAEFIQASVLEKYLGKLIHGEQDRSNPKIFFTKSFISRSKAKIKGALVGLTRPTPVAAILNQLCMTDKLFFSLFDQIALYGFLTSRVAGAQYVPNIYSRSQNEWVNNFYKQNGYVEFDALTRLGILDHKTYLKKQFANFDTIMLKTCITSNAIVERLEADIEECISSKSYVDLQNNLPSVFNNEDINIIVNKVLTSSKHKLVVVINNYVISKAFMENLSKSCESIVKEKAKRIVESGQYQQHLIETQLNSKVQNKVDEEVKVDKREERRKKAAGGKSGGGTQGRETKTKSTKKFNRGSKTFDENEDVEVSDRKAVLSVVTHNDILTIIQPQLEEESLEELVESISDYLLPILNENGLEIAANLYVATISDRTANRRHTHNDVQNKLNTLIGDIRLFEKGIKLLPQDIQSQFCKYILKTLCTDIVNEFLNYISAEEGLNVVTDNFTNEQRLKLINDLPQDYKSFQGVVKSLSGQNIEEFMTIIEECLASCSMILKKIDKKKDRLVILNHKQALLEQLEKCEDPALVLHLTTLILFIGVTQSMLHASGRHVASILAFLKSHISQEQFTELTSYHDSVTLMLSGSPEEADSANDKLKEKMSTIKSIAVEYRKSSEKS